MPSSIIAQILNDETSLTSGTDLFIGPRRAYDPQGFMPHKCVFILQTGGLRSRPLKSTGVDERKINVQVWIRSDHIGTPNAFQNGEILAQRILNTLDRRRLLGICDMRAISSHPISLGPDDDGHWEWTVNFEVTQDFSTGYARFFIGTLASPGPYTESDIQSLLEFGGLSSPAMSTTISPVNQYIVYAYPDEFGGKPSTDFFLGSIMLPGDMTEVQSGLAVVDDFGVSGLYTVARSDNLLDVTVISEPMQMKVV